MYRIRKGLLPMQMPLARVRRGAEARAQMDSTGATSSLLGKGAFLPPFLLFDPCFAPVLFTATMTSYIDSEQAVLIAIGQTPLNVPSFIHICITQASGPPVVPKGCWRIRQWRSFACFLIPYARRTSVAGWLALCCGVSSCLEGPHDHPWPQRFAEHAEARVMDCILEPSSPKIERDKVFGS